MFLSTNPAAAQGDVTGSAWEPLSSAAGRSDAVHLDDLNLRLRCVQETKCGEMCSEHQHGRLFLPVSHQGSPELSYNRFLSFQTQFLWDAPQAQQPAPLMTIIPLSFPRGTVWPSGRPCARKHSTRVQLLAGQHPAPGTLLVRGQSIPFREQHTVQCSAQPQDRGNSWSRAAEPAAATQPCTKTRGRPMSAWQLSAARNKAEGCECDYLTLVLPSCALRAEPCRHGSSDGEAGGLGGAVPRLGGCAAATKNSRLQLCGCPHAVCAPAGDVGRPLCAGSAHRCSLGCPARAGKATGDGGFSGAAARRLLVASAALVLHTRCASAVNFHDVSSTGKGQRRLQPPPGRRSLHRGCWGFHPSALALVMGFCGTSRPSCPSGLRTAGYRRRRSPQPQMPGSGTPCTDPAVPPALPPPSGRPRPAPPRVMAALVRRGLRVGALLAASPRRAAATWYGEPEPPDAVPDEAERYGTAGPSPRSGGPGRSHFSLPAEHGGGGQRRGCGGSWARSAAPPSGR